MRLPYILTLFTMALSCDNPSEIKTVKMDTELLFVGTYTDKEGHVDGQADGIYALEFDIKKGLLKNTDIRVTTTNPSYLSIDKENDLVYAVNEKVGEGEAISSFGFRDSTLIPLNKVDAYGGAPCYLTVVGSYLMTANYVGGNHVVYDIKTDGSIGDTIQIIQNQGSGASPRQEGPHAHMIIQNPHNEDVITADLGADEVTFYSISKGIKTLERKFVLKLEEGSGPRHIAFHPIDNILYILNELSGSIAVVKAIGKDYEVVQSIAGTAKGDPSQSGSAAIHVHENGEFLYFSNRGTYNSIAQFQIGEDGLLTFNSEVSSGGEAPRDFCIDPSGKFLLAANQNSDNIVVFSINQENGELNPSGQVFSAPTPVCLKFY